MTPAELAAAPELYLYTDKVSPGEAQERQGRMYRGMILGLAGVYRGQRFVASESILLYN